MVMPHDFATTDVAAKFATYPDKPRQMLLTIRHWIFEIAGDEASIGTLDESLKWGEPAWRPKSGSGITIRADWKEKVPDQVMVFFDCKTDLRAIGRSSCRLIRPCPKQPLKPPLAGR